MINKKNFAYQFSYQLLIIIIPLITTPYVSRVFGPSGIGLYSYTLSYATYFSLFAMLGIQNHGVRLISQNRKDKETLSKNFFSLFYMHLIISIISMVLYFTLVTLISTSENRILFFIQGIVILASLLDISWFFFGLENFKTIVLRNVLIKIITTILIFSIVKNSDDLLVYSLILAIGTLLSQIIVWPYIFKYIVKIKVSIADIKKHFRPLIVLFIPVISISIYKIMNKIILGLLVDENAVGYFENTQKATSIPTSLITALGMVMLPAISGMVKKNKDKEIIKHINNSMLFTAFISSAIFFTSLGSIKYFVSIFFGESFSGIDVYINMLLSSIFFIGFANIIRTHYLLPYKLDKFYVNSIIIGAVINLILNFLLVPYITIYGSIISVIITEFIVFVLQAWFVRKKLPIKQYLLDFVPFLCFGLLSYLIVEIFIHYLKLDDLYIFIISAASIGFLYFVFSLSYYWVFKRDNLIYICKQFFKKEEKI